MKTCKQCGETKPLDDFYRATGMHDGRRNDCKTCNLGGEEESIRLGQGRCQQQSVGKDETRSAFGRTRPSTEVGRSGSGRMRDRYYRRTYGLTADEVDEMLAAQGGVCAICRELPEVEARMHIDHDHRSGAIRGVLCSRCNHAHRAAARGPGSLRSGC